MSTNESTSPEASSDEKLVVDRAGQIKSLESAIKKAQKRIREIHHGDYDLKMKSQGERREAVKTCEYEIERARKSIAELKL